MRKDLEPWAKANLGKDLTGLDLFAIGEKIGEITSKLHGTGHRILGGYMYFVLSSGGLLQEPWRGDTPQ